MLKLFEEILTVVEVEFRWTTGGGIVRQCRLDRFAEEPIEPVADSFLDNTVPFGQRLKLISLLAANRREYSFPRFSFVHLFTKLSKFFQRDIVESAHDSTLLHLSIKDYARPYEEGPRQPKQIATDDRITFSDQYIGQRCRTLASYGLVQNLGNGLYAIMNPGKQYLAGELDTRDLSQGEN